MVARILGIHWHEQAIKYVRGNYTWDNVALKMIEIYQKIIVGKSDRKVNNH